MHAHVIWTTQDIPRVVPITHHTTKMWKEHVLLLVWVWHVWHTCVKQKETESREGGIFTYKSPDCSHIFYVHIYVCSSTRQLNSSFVFMYVHTTLSMACLSLYEREKKDDTFIQNICGTVKDKTTGINFSLRKRDECKFNQGKGSSA